MEIKSTTTIKFDKKERDTLVDAARILDDVFSRDIRNVIQFDVGGLSLIDPDDIAEMIRKLINISDEDAEVQGCLEI